MRRGLLAGAAAMLALAGCARPGTCRGDYCGTLVFVTFSQPDILLPPITQQAAARDIHDQIFLKLADVRASMNTLGDRDFEPQLAERWEWRDPLTLVFHLSPRARWQDGPAVTAADVAFTFDAYTDTSVNAPARESLRDIESVTPVAGDSLAVTFRFRRHYSEMFFDAVYHMRILPAHLLAHVPRDQWVRAPFGHAPVGDGPYRFVSWKPGESVELVADSTCFLGRPHIRRLIWRFTPDPPTALTQLIAGEADALEFLGPAANIERARGAPQLAIYPYKGTAYGYLAFNMTNPILSDRDVRRALALAVDREKLRESVFQNYALVPPGPVSQAWPLWLGDSTHRAPPPDTAQAAALLTRRGWRDTNGDGIRDRGGVKLAFHILVPTTSAVRRQYARLLQEQFRAIGADVQVDEVENQVFQQQAGAGKFDAAMATFVTDPTPTADLARTWTKAGFGSANWGRYSNPAVDQALVRAAAATGGPAATLAAWQDAIRLLDADAPGIWLFAPTSVAAVHRRVADVTIRPDSWWALVRTWRIPANQLIARDRVLTSDVEAKR